MIDAQRFAHTAAYLSKLPAGLESYPECMVKADLHADLPQQLAHLSGTVELPGQILTFIKHGPSGKWMPETLANALLLLMRDTVHKNEEAYFAWDYERNIKSFKSPLNRVLMRVFSSTLLIMGATKRWSNYHQGTMLQSEPVTETQGRKSTRGNLSFPSHLYNEFIIRLFGGSYKAALDMSNAKDTAVSLDHIDNSSAVFTLSWRD